MLTDDQLFDLLGKNAELFAAYEEWANAQIMLLAGTVDDPNSFNEAGGKTGVLGYYPVVNVSGQTIYVPCQARLMAIALGGSNAAVLEQLVAQVAGKLAVVENAVAGAGAATALATTKAALAEEKATLAAQKAAAAQTVVDAGAAILAAAAPVTGVVARTTKLEGAVAPLTASIRQTPGVFLTGNPLGRKLNGLGFVISKTYLDGEQTRTGQTSSTSTARSRRRNALGFVTQRETLGGSTRFGRIISPTIDRIDAALAAIAGQFTSWALPNTPAFATVAAYSDGRSLYNWRAARSRAKAGLGVARVMYRGHSWTEKRPIPQQTHNLLAGDIGDAGAGWISVFANNIADTQDTGPINGATFSRSAGWTAYDASTGDLPPSFGCSHEGHAISTTLSDKTLTYTFTGTAFEFFYPQLAGVWQVRIDGAPYTAVASNGSGALAKLSITGLAAGPHTINFNTAANTGGQTVAAFGARYYTEGASGVEVQKCGNSAITSQQFMNVLGRVAPMMAQLKPDVIIYILCTNDYRAAGNTPASHVAFLTADTAEIRSVLPNVGFIFVLDARTVATAPPTELSAYRDAVSVWCRANGHEFYNMYDEWADWTVESAAGMWLDNSHVSIVAGAYRLANRLYRLFLSA